MDRCPQLSLIGLQQVSSPPPDDWQLTGHPPISQSVRGWAAERFGMSGTLIALLLACQNRCTVLCYQGTPPLTFWTVSWIRSAWRIREGFIASTQNPPFLFIFGWKYESTDFSVCFFFPIFAKSPVLVCQITQHECLRGTCRTAPLYAEMWKIWVSIWQ